MAGERKGLGSGRRAEDKESARRLVGDKRGLGKRHARGLMRNGACRICAGSSRAAQGHYVDEAGQHIIISERSQERPNCVKAASKSRQRHGWPSRTKASEHADICANHLVHTECAHLDHRVCTPRPQSVHT
eukprot:6193115-Pleurochrysis_carterae.AAC.4